MSGLAPHPWDEIAARIAPTAQTVEEAARILDQKDAEKLNDEIADLERDIDYKRDEINEAEEEIERLEGDLGKLVARRDGAA